MALGAFAAGLAEGYTTVSEARTRHLQNQKLIDENQERAKARELRAAIGSAAKDFYSGSAAPTSSSVNGQAQAVPVQDTSGSSAFQADAKLLNMVASAGGKPPGSQVEQKDWYGFADTIDRIYAQSGDLVAGQKVRESIEIRAKSAFSRQVQAAYAYLQNGNLEAAAAALSKAHQNLPDGRSSTYSIENGKLFATVVSERTGRPVGEKVEVTPEFINRVLVSSLNTTDWLEQKNTDADRALKVQELSDDKDYKDAVIKQGSDNVGINKDKLAVQKARNKVLENQGQQGLDLQKRIADDTKANKAAAQEISQQLADNQAALTELTEARNKVLEHQGSRRLDHEEKRLNTSIEHNKKLLELQRLGVDETITKGEFNRNEEFKLREKEAIIAEMIADSNIARNKAATENDEARIKLEERNIENLKEFRDATTANDVDRIDLIRGKMIIDQLQFHAEQQLEIQLAEGAARAGKAWTPKHTNDALKLIVEQNFVHAPGILRRMPAEIRTKYEDDPESFVAVLNTATAIVLSEELAKGNTNTNIIEARDIAVRNLHAAAAERLRARAVTQDAIRAKELNKGPGFLGALGDALAAGWNLENELLDAREGRAKDRGSNTASENSVSLLDRVSKSVSGWAQLINNVFGGLPTEPPVAVPGAPSSVEDSGSLPGRAEPPIGHILGGERAGREGQQPAVKPATPNPHLRQDRPTPQPAIPYLDSGPVFPGIPSGVPRDLLNRHRLRT